KKRRNPPLEVVPVRNVGVEFLGLYAFSIIDSNAKDRRPPGPVAPLHESPDQTQAPRDPGRPHTEGNDPPPRFSGVYPYRDLRIVGNYPELGKSGPVKISAQGTQQRSLMR